MKRKKILFQSDFALAKTGFGRNARAVLTYLYKTGKYDITHYCCGVIDGSPELKKTPWKSIGTLPSNPIELQEIQKNSELARMASYGAHRLDAVISEEKPDVYIAVQDIWGVDFAIEKKWYKEITSTIWTTLDSLPILPTAVEAAKKSKNYWVWSNFAAKELNRTGFKNVETLHGAVDVQPFFKMPDEARMRLRQIFSIDPNLFIVGFVFRNQLRKTVSSLIEGFKEFQNRNPKSPSKLLLHTNFSEGWNIPRFASEYNVKMDDILTTYICKECGGYKVMPFRGQDGPCEFCGNPKSIVTTCTGYGITEQQLNEVYNLMDVYCHPFTSGGQEIPIQEAKLVELITLVTNYSCGEEMCEPEAHSLPLDWSEYREHNTEFKKASTLPSSVTKQLSRVLKMKPEARREMGKKAREWAIKNFSPEVVGGRIEKFIDDAPFTEFNFKLNEEQKDPDAEIPEEKDNSKWITTLYKKILKRAVLEDDEGHQYWMNEIRKGLPREQIEKFFRRTAQKDNLEKQRKDLNDLLDNEGKENRIVYVIPETDRDIFLSTSLFKSIKETYPTHNLYVATNTNYFGLLKGNPYVHKLIPYSPQMDDIFMLEGRGEHEGFFEIAFLPYVNTHKVPNFTHNGKDKINYDLRCTS